MARWDPAHVTPRVKLYMHTKFFFRSVAPRVFLAKILFLAFFRYNGNYFPDFLAHLLRWIKTYHHAKFQRNPATSFARMIVQIYRQTDILTSSFIYRIHIY